MMKKVSNRIIVTMLIVAIAISCGGCSTFGGRIYGKALDEASAIDSTQGVLFLEVILDDMVADDLDAITSLGYHAGEPEAATFEDFWEQWQSLKETYGMPLSYEMIDAYNYGDDLAFVGAYTMENGGTLMIQMLFSDKFELYRLYLYESAEDYFAQVEMPDTVVEETVIIGEGTEHELEGRITMPADAATSGKTYPAAVLVPGDGGNTMDMTAGNSYLYRDLAWALAEQGIVTIRYDKRNYTYLDEAVAEDADISVFTVAWEYTDDANLAAGLLLQKSYVDSESVFYVGHSQGAQVGSRADEEAGGLYAGFVLINSSPRYWYDVIYDQYINYGLIDRSQEEIYYLANKIKVEREFIEEGSCSKLDEEELCEDFILSRAAAFWVDYLSYDYVDGYKRLAKPTLILQGSMDYQITEDTDFAAWQTEMADCSFAELISYEGLDHLLMESKGIFMGHYKEYDIPSVADEAPLNDIARFILENTN